MELNTIIKFFDYYPYVQNRPLDMYCHLLIQGLAQLFNIHNIEDVIKNSEYNQFILSLKAYAKKEEIEEFFHKINTLLMTDDNSQVNKLIEDINMILLSWCRLRDKHRKFSGDEEKYWAKFFKGHQEITKYYPKAFVFSSIQWQRWRCKNIYQGPKENYEYIKEYDYCIMGSINEDKKKIINDEIEKLTLIDKERSIITNKINNISIINRIDQEVLIFISMMSTIIMLILVIFIL